MGLHRRTLDTNSCSLIQIAVVAATAVKAYKNYSTGVEKLIVNTHAHKLNTRTRHHFARFVLLSSVFDTDANAGKSAHTCYGKIQPCFVPDPARFVFAVVRLTKRWSKHTGTQQLCVSSLSIVCFRS